MSDLLRVYEAHDLGGDGYPPEWHVTIKHLVRANADHRCVRCYHPYRKASTATASGQRAETTARTKGHGGGGYRRATNGTSLMGRC